MPLFTVIGVYADNLENRYADYIDAETPDEAEREVRRRAKAESGAEIIIAGVVEGRANLVA